MTQKKNKKTLYLRLFTQNIYYSKMTSTREFFIVIAHLYRTAQKKQTIQVQRLISFETFV